MVYQANAMNHNYNTPSEGTIDWHIPVNENFEQIDTDVEVRDVAENRSNYTPKEHAKFLAIDTGEVYLGDGSNWNYLGGLVSEQTGGGNQYIDVREFGADPSTADNTQAIQTAIDEAVSSGVRSVLIPEFYEVNPDKKTVFRLPSDIEIYGLGPATGIYNTQEWGTSNASTHATFRLKPDASNVHIHDLFLRGTQTDDAMATGDQVSHGSHISSSNDNSNDNLTVSNVTALDARTFLNFKGQGGLNVENCTVLNCSRGIVAVSATDVNINNIVHKRWPINDRDGFCYRTVFLDGVARTNVTNVTGDSIGAENGSGTAILISAEWGPATSPADVNISNCSLKARDTSTSAKGIMVMSAGKDMRDINFSNIHTDGFEATIAFWNKSGHKTVKNVTFENVTGNPSSTAIYAKHAGVFEDVTFRDCRIEGAPIGIAPPETNHLSDWTFDGGQYISLTQPHQISSSRVENFTFNGVTFESSGSDTLVIQGDSHGRFQFINCEVNGGGLVVETADRLEMMMGRYSSLDVRNDVGSGWIRNTEITDGSLVNEAGLPTDNVEGV